MLAACTSAQKPYYVGYQTATAYVGDSPGAACKYFSDAASVTFTNATEHACSTSAGSFAIVKSCDDRVQVASGTSVGTSTVIVTAESFTAERQEADMWMFAQMLFFLSAVWAAKQLYNLFRTGRYES